MMLMMMMTCEPGGSPDKVKLAHNQSTPATDGACGHDMTSQDNTTPPAMVQVLHVADDRDSFPTAAHLQCSPTQLLPSVDAAHLRCTLPCVAQPVQLQGLGEPVGWLEDGKGQTSSGCQPPVLTLKRAVTPAGLHAQGRRPFP